MRQTVRVATVEARRPVAVGCDVNTYSRLQLMVCGDGNRLLFSLSAGLLPDSVAVSARCDRGVGKGPARGGAPSRFFRTSANAGYRQRRLLHVQMLPRLCERAFQSRSHPVSNPHPAGLAGPVSWNLERRRGVRICNLYEGLADTCRLLAAYRECYNRIRLHWVFQPVGGGDPLVPADVYLD